MQDVLFTTFKALFDMCPPLCGIPGMSLVLATAVMFQLVRKETEIGFPFNNDRKLRKMADEFSKFSSGKMTNCVLAIDGWVCRSRCPTASEVQFPTSYRNRHGCFGIVHNVSFCSVQDGSYHL